MQHRRGNSRSFAPRAGLLLAITAIHAALILLLAQRSIRPKAAAVAPITVGLLTPAPRAPEAVKLAPLVPSEIRPTTIAAPEFNIPTDAAAATAIVARESGQPSASAPASSAPTSSDPPSMSDVSYLQAPKPIYPREARLAHEEGLVILRVLIDESGHVKNIDILRSSGHSRLDLEACNAVAHALFRPYSAGGVARSAIATVPIEFSLHRS